MRVLPYRPLSHAVLAGMVLAGLMLAVARTSALTAGTLTIHFQNDTVDNLAVTVYDRNLQEHPMIISGQVIYSNASLAATIAADSAGQGHIYWMAMTTDPHMRQCGHHDKAAINDGDTIRVSADSPCSP